MVSTIAAQMVGFALMLALGALCARVGMVDRPSLRPMIALSTKVFLPALLFATVCERVSADVLREQLPMVALAAVFYAAIVAAMGLLSRALRLDAGHSGPFRMAFIFGNTGFIGLPVLVAVLRETGAANLVLFMLVDQLVLWTYGASLAGREGAAHSWRAMLKGFLNLNVVAMLAALACQLGGVPVCGAAVDLLATLGAAATPLCMVCLGAMCSLPDIAGVLRRKELYLGVAAKMVALPLCAAPLLRALPVAGDVATSMLLMMAMPPTTLVPLAVEANGGDGPYAASLTVTTIALAALTLPLVAWAVGA